MRRAEYTFINARIVHGSGGPILRIAGVSPAMLGACKSSGRYHLTLIGPNPETGSTPVRFLKHATFLDFCIATVRVIMR